MIREDTRSSPLASTYRCIGKHTHTYTYTYKHIPYTHKTKTGVIKHACNPITRKLESGGTPDTKQKNK